MGSALTGVLDWLDEPGQVTRNVLRGNLPAAGRNLVDFLGDIPDAFLPGDLIPHLARSEDKVSGGELVGLKDPGLMKTLADIAVGTATDPLSWLSFGASGGVKAAVPLIGKELGTIANTSRAVDPLSVAGRVAGKALDQGLDLADQGLGKLRPATTVRRTPVRDWATAQGRSLKQAFALDTPTPAAADLLAQAGGTGQVSRRAGMAEATRILGKLSQGEQEALGDAFDALDWQGGKAAGILAGATPGERLAELAKAGRIDGGRLPALQQAAEALQGLHGRQWQEAIDRKAIVDATGSGGRKDYLRRSFAFPAKHTLGGMTKPGAADALSERSLESPQELLAFLQDPKNAGVGYERNALRRAIERAHEQGDILGKAQVGAGVVGGAGQPWVSLKDSGAVATAALEAMAKHDPATAGRLAASLNGLGSRGGLTSALAATNRYLKPAMVYGIAIPKLGSIVRNRVGMAWQAWSQPGIPAAARAQVLASTGRDLAFALNEGWAKMFGSRFMGPDKLAGDLNEMDQAVKGAGGTVAGAKAALAASANPRAPYLAEALDRGVVDGWVSAEEGIKAAVRSPAWAKTKDIMDAPGEMFRVTEERGRLGLYLDLRARGRPPEEAAKLVRDAFIDYSVTSGPNRTLRDLIPFAQFLVGSIPQQAKLLSRAPAVGVALAPLMGNDQQDGPVYPWMEGQTRIGLGQDDHGNPLFGVGLGLPVEALSAIPNPSDDLIPFGRSIMRKVVGASHPLLKSAIAPVAGVDPYFLTPYGSYAKEPFTGKESDAGRAYRELAGTGLIEPIAGPIRLLEDATADRPAGVRAADLLTGLNVVSVDPDRAVQQVLNEDLAADPSVRRHVSYYVTDHNAEAQGLIDRLNTLRQKVKMQDRAEAAPSP